MNTVLGGQFTSRVNMNLREDKHWSYGAGTLLCDARGPRPFLAYAPVQTDKTKESVQELLKELRGIRGERPVTADELKAAQDSMTLHAARPVGDERRGAGLDRRDRALRLRRPTTTTTYAAKVRAV